MRNRNVDRIPGLALNFGFVRAGVRVAAAGIACLIALESAAPRLLDAQSVGNSVNRALEVEQAGRWLDAVAAWRAVLESGEISQGALGLERVFAQLGQEDSIRVLVDSLLVDNPAQRLLRGIQLRTLRTLGRDADEELAFDAWLAASPNDMAPYKEYASQLLGDSRTERADSVLQRGVRSLGEAGFRLELTQLRVALGQWGAGASLWRELIREEPYLDQAAYFSLGIAPASSRDSVREALAKPPSPPGARKVLGRLELEWGNPREGWRILSSLTVADSAMDVWAEFVSEAERQGAWIPARDALLRIAETKPQLSLLLRAASAAVR